MEFPYGKAAFSILVLTVLMSLVLGTLGLQEKTEAKPDLVYATFTPEHYDTYIKIIPEFERLHNCHIQLQLVDQRALQQRLEAELEAGAPVPDMIELMDGTLGFFTRGPISDVGFIDLTDKIHSSGLYDKLVKARFTKWSSRGHIFALPHDVHPAMLCYRRDLCEQLGIDVSKLSSWDEFARVGRQITEESKDSRGIAQHYMIDLQADGGDMLRMMLLQRGGSLLDKNGECVFDSDIALDCVIYYVEATQDPPHPTPDKHKFSFPAGWGQPLAEAMTEGLDLFYVCPDWRTRQFELQIPAMNGKLAVMPLPAWEPGGSRTSTWGGTGLAFAKSCHNFDLGWQLAMYLYYNPKSLGPRFLQMNILPPLREAWTLPEINQPRAFFSNQPIGTLYARLADQVPEEIITPYITDARDKFGEAYIDAALYYQQHGEDGLRDYAKADLKRCADQVRVLIHRNVFFEHPAVAAGTAQEGTHSH
jgi:arabinosaccharide transport system substrate-binding protein